VSCTNSSFPIRSSLVNPLNLSTDNYDRPARLYPALLTIAPILIATVAIISADELTLLKSLGAFILGCGGTFLLSQLGRDFGNSERHVKKDCLNRGEDFRRLPFSAIAILG
jgi:hypothetical protein